MNYSVGKIQNSVYHYLKFYFFIAYAYFLNFFQHIQSIVDYPLIEIYDNEKEYLKKRTNEFQRSEPCNSNISPIFYNKKEYDEYMKINKESELETQWKKRILLEYTPRGNITMYYDPYKMCFSYSSDNKTISYDLLNVCAMKYVRLFRCYDFYMDEMNIPNTYTNPFIKIHYGDETPLKNNSSNKIPNTKEGPFIKRRQEENKNGKEIEPEKMKNKFLYIGKLSNFNFLNIPSSSQKTKSIAMFHSPLIDNLEKNAEVQNSRLSYKYFKSLNSSST